MKKFLYIIPILTFMCTQVLANSSWHWVSQSKPYHILPIAVIITLLIEVVGIIRFAKTGKTKTIITVIIANIISYAMPYILALCGWYGFEKTLNNTPFYNIGIAYLMMTLIVELPVVCSVLEPDTPNKKRLIITVTAVNVVTTVVTFFLERALCHGVW